ncbi:probable transcriptional regulator SLK2 [Cynara cardunculus var. scolymus]|uniref:probable transcriptional regulator SLK2 n=1 Tax=Cynara cardunculus var. scolymus TaxID=59895 RepID=UPI000D625D5B|nr:probable transcriptional regulator SLK2 [Cynara cardunculus var. scolymus]XP_024992322.1 probable transcriptional regulator SLK2 [Cynara cardunculus var. scolymus]XP_024992323.1 probable transcriptional regulator SLK2 [Cynara cardunculus var. scolymus]
MVHSSSSSGIFFQGDEQSQALRNSHLSSYGNSNLRSRNMYSNMVPVSGEVSNAVMDSAASSGPSIGASSLVTDANSVLSGGTPCLQRSASISTESYVRLPASPLSFSSNNISISGSSVIDAPSPVQQSSIQDPNFHYGHQQGPRQGASTATSLPNPRLGRVQFPEGSMFPGSFVSDHDNLSHLQKKPRLDIKQDDILQEQVLRQILQRQDSMQLQSPNLQLQALYQQQQLLQSLSPAQRAHLLQQQQQQLHSRQNFQQQGLQPASAVNRPYDGGVCSRRLMQYLYHQRQRPADISYWRKFVAEYYSPRAKKRWCLSLHNNVGHHPLGVFPPAAMDVWQCSICGSKSGRGFEATFEVLPRLNEIKFGSGVIDELWFLDLPRECRSPSGVMMLEYGKAVQESVYAQMRVVHEGRLKVIFTPDLKILTWEFCSRRHEELLPRRLVAPQVNQLLEVAQKWQSTIAESGSGGVSQQDLQTNSNMVVTAGRQLARSLELQSLNDLGFTKRYVRCLQISEVVNSMKDLMDFSQETKAGPIEALKNFPRQTSVAKLQMQKMQGMEQMGSIQGLPADRNAISNLVALHPGSMNNNFHMGSRGGPLGSVQAALALSEYQNKMMRQSSMNSNSQQDASSSFQNRSPLEGRALQNNNGNILVGGRFSSLQLPYQQFPSGVFQVQQEQSSSQHQMIQQALKDMNNNDGGGVRSSISGQSAGGPTRSNSFKAGSHSDSCAGGEKAGDLPHVSDVFQDIASELTENGFFNNDEREDGMGYGWKA